jgi:hypothetical protein
VPFKANVGGLDRAVRLAVGAVLLVVGAWFEVTTGGGLGALISLVGLFVLVSGLIRFCILYVPFGISTARRRDLAIEKANQ